MEKASDSESECELPTETASTLKPTDRQDGRKLAFPLKWEKAYPWAYYSSIKGGWFCKICEECSQTGDKFWKTVPKKHDTHPGEAFKEHSGSKKHTDAICSKKEIQSILSKGNIITQLQRGQEIRSETDRKKNRDLIKKLIKTVYFLAKNNMAVKQNFEKFVKFIAFQLEEKLFASHLSNAPKNPNYCTANSVEEYLKVIGDFLNEKLIDDLLATGDVTVLADESTDDANRS